MRMVLLNLILIPAVRADLSSEKIPNQWILAGWGMGILYQIFYAGVSGVACGLLGAVFPILVLFLFFMLRMLGAGDIKLLSVVGMFYGISPMIRLILLVFGFGAVLSLLHMLKNRIFVERFSYLWNYVRLEKGSGRPYYDGERDGKKPVIHFSIAILGGVILWELLNYVS